MEIRHGNHFLLRMGPGGNQDGSGEQEWPRSPITCPLWDHQAGHCRERTKGGIRSRHRCWTPKTGHLDYFQFSTIINNSATTVPMDKSLCVVLFIALGSIPRVRSLSRRLIILPNCPPERLYLFMLPPAASKRAHFPRSLLTSGLIKHYILSLFNPGSELFFLLLLSWRQRFLAQGTGNISLWGRLQVRNCYLSRLQQNHKSFLGLAEDPSLQIPCLW